MTKDDHLNPLASFHAARADKAETEVQVLRKFANAVIENRKTIICREIEVIATDVGLLEVDYPEPIAVQYRKTTLLTGEPRDGTGVGMREPQKFRKKPVVIEAWNFDGSWESVKGLVNREDTALTWYSDGTLSITTLEGVMTATSGDWIIKGTAGEFYPCKPDIFANIYELVPKDTEVNK